MDTVRRIARTLQRAAWRRELDVRLAANSLRNLADLGDQGWVREVRDALSMTTRQLAHRMGLTQSAVTQIERNEVAGSVRLDTLHRAADALGCDLVYAFIPRTSLEQTRRDQATAVATAAFADDTGDPEVRRRRIDHYAARLLQRGQPWTAHDAGG